MLSQKRVELSALTQEGEQSAKGCSERGCQHPPPPNPGEGSPGLLWRPALGFLMATSGGSDQGWASRSSFSLVRRSHRGARLEAATPLRQLECQNYRILYTGTKSQQS